MGITTLFGLKVCVIFSKVASCGFMWLGNVYLLNNKMTKLKKLSLFNSKIEMVSIIRSLLGSATPPLLLLVWNLGVMTHLRTYRTYLLLDILDQMVLENITSWLLYINFARIWESASLFSIVIWGFFGINLLLLSQSLTPSPRPSFSVNTESVYVFISSWWAFSMTSSLYTVSCLIILLYPLSIKLLMIWSMSKLV